MRSTVYCCFKLIYDLAYMSLSAVSLPFYVYVTSVMLLLLCACERVQAVVHM